MASLFPGNELELRVESLAYGGAGVARANGLVVFVRGAFPGDLVRARITRLRTHFAEADTLAVLAPSAERVAAPCAHYPACGGCRMQDLAYPAQARLKETQVRESLERIGRIRDAVVEPIVAADEPFGYRNKMEYSFTDTPRGVAPGLHHAGRFDEVLEIDRCWITTELGNAVRDAVREWARGEGLARFDLASGTGLLRDLVVREGRRTDQALVLLVTAPGELPGVDRLVARLRVFPAVRSIQHGVMRRSSDAADLPTTALWGEPTIEEEILGLRFRIGATTFLQPNTRMCERLYGVVLELAGLEPGDAVYDLYCGIGALSLHLARRARSVFGVEISRASVALARENAARNGVTNAAFETGDVAAVLHERHATEPPEVVVVDPPRAGLAPKALSRVGSLAAGRLVYVSCNPTTLAGDAKRLHEEHGYRLARARPVDMFPHTAHVETVALFTR